ncbi:1,4-alpha-glucan-branching enzyme [Planctomycetales bacterium ZRK34]|nr:1,4-alpha-glucan-branching enzyme [Planctomycetales bacterium ZRK34]
MKPDGTGLIERDSWLEPHREVLRRRFEHIQNVRRQFDDAGGLTGQVSQAHHYFGFNRGEKDGAPGVWYREWAPGAQMLSLIGEFNNWSRDANPMRRDAYGVWSCFLPDAEYADRFTHETAVKVFVASQGSAGDKIPAYIKRVTQVPNSIEFVGHYWQPPEPYVWQHESPTTIDGGLRIYEGHVGMSQEEGKVGSFDEFRLNVLPRIADLGYNTVQLMAVQQHPYYGSFGYHVSNLFAVSSFFGTPYQLKQLIDAAHGLGLRVIMDIVHSHMVKNTAEGLNRFDGTDHQYFHGPPRGDHVAWDSKCYDYSKYEVLRLLLSNCRYWLDEYRFDGYRFDGVTSMLYLDHGLGKTFSSYDDYFSPNTDWDAVAYLTLANDVIHAVRPDAVTVAEDMSGMPGTARPTDEGGLGFDYRLAMGVPDFWIKTLKEQADEQWNLGSIFGTLLNRRHGEKHIGYAESHDQALVGDKTLAFWLMDKHMYEGMSIFQQDVVIARGIALHKMIRLITFTLAGEAYLNFMGNEFGHPEWIDFPREGNNFSYHHARRQWSLVDADHLRYKGLNNFDRAMQQLDKQYNLLNDPLIEQLVCHEDTRQLVYRRGPLVFAFNFHPNESYSDLRIPVPDQTDYKLVINTDATDFEGQGLVAPGCKYVWQDTPMYGRDQSLQIYLPARSALVLAPA